MIKPTGYNVKWSKCKRIEDDFFCDFSFHFDWTECEIPSISKYFQKRRYKSNALVNGVVRVQQL